MYLYENVFVSMKNLNTTKSTDFSVINDNFFL